MATHEAEAEAENATNGAHWDLAPRCYQARRLDAPIDIDGDISKAQWQQAAWSQDFADIRGEDAPAGAHPSDQCRTRVKMMWDDDFLYIAAELRSDFPVVAEFTERNSPIFHKDSDFEVFVDPAGSCHHYKELELNAINTIWNLMLNRPYMDGGDEFSGRVAAAGEPRYYEVAHQRTATRLVGELDDPNGATWTVEIALAHQDTTAIPVGCPPNGCSVPPPPAAAVGVFWRINFSRVEERGAINWTWSPMRAWDPEQLRVVGKVNMHMPESWGYLQFVDSEGGTPVLRDNSWPARLVASSIYYAQHRYKATNGKFATAAEELAGLLPEHLLDGFEIDITTVVGGDWATTVKPAGGGGQWVSMTSDHLIMTGDVQWTVGGSESECG